MPHFDAPRTATQGAGASIAMLMTVSDSGLAAPVPGRNGRAGTLDSTAWPKCERSHL